jgi:hypothetical protein
MLKIEIHKSCADNPGFEADEDLKLLRAPKENFNFQQLNELDKVVQTNINMRDTSPLPMPPSPTLVAEIINKSKCKTANDGVEKFTQSVSSLLSIVLTILQKILFSLSF